MQIDAWDMLRAAETRVHTAISREDQLIHEQRLLLISKDKATNILFQLRLVWFISAIRTPQNRSVKIYFILGHGHHGYR